MFLYLRCLNLTEDIILCVDSSCLLILRKRSISGCCDCRKQTTILHLLSPVTAEETTILLVVSSWLLEFLPLTWLSRFSFAFFFQMLTVSFFGFALFILLTCVNLQISRKILLIIFSISVLFFFPHQSPFPTWSSVLSQLC